MTIEVPATLDDDVAVRFDTPATLEDNVSMMLDTPAALEDNTSSSLDVPTVDDAAIDEVMNKLEDETSALDVPGLSNHVYPVMESGSCTSNLVQEKRRGAKNASNKLKVENGKWRVVRNVILVCSSISCKELSVFLN